MPYILCRYVLREILWPTVLATVTLTFIILSTRKVPGREDERLLMFLLRLLFRDDIPKGDVLSVLMLVLPTLLLFLVPMALLIGITIGVGRMTLDLEVRAMQTSGINLSLVFLPVMLAAAALSVISGALYYAPEPMMIRATMARAGKLLISEFSNLEPGRVYDDIFKGRGGLSLYFESRDELKMKGVTLVLDRSSVKSGEEKDSDKKKRSAKTRQLKEDLKSGKIDQEEFFRLEHELKLEKKSERPVLIFARQAGFETDAERGTVRLALEDGSIHLADSSPKSEKSTDPDAHAPAAAHGKSAVSEGGTAKGNQDDYCVLAFGRFEKGEKIVSDDSASGRRAMTIPELVKSSQDPEAKSRIRLRSKATILERYSLALECFVLALIGLPLAVWVKPTGKSIGVVLAFGLILVYQWLMRTGFSMVESGHPLGTAMIFSPNVLFAAAGSALWWRMVRR